jgi:hypothetical protein
MTPSMTCEQFEIVLPDLLDDDAGPAAMTPLVRSHLEQCVDCRAVFSDLRRVRSVAGSLPALTPSRDLWAGIASRIETPIVPLVEGAPMSRPRRHVSWRAAGAAAAAVVVINIAVGYAVMARKASPVARTAIASIEQAQIPAPSMMQPAVHSPMRLPLPVPVTVTSPRRPTIVLAGNGVDDEQPDDQAQDQPTRRREAAKLVYDREIARLRAIVDSGRARLDPATVAILERNLRVIDTAIEQCNEALAKDSSSTFLMESLNNAYQTKVKLLRIAAAAASRG